MGDAEIEMMAMGTERGVLGIVLGRGGNGVERGSQSRDRVTLRERSEGQGRT